MATSSARPTLPHLSYLATGLPQDWTILRDRIRIGAVVCPDQETAMHLATFRYGVGCEVERRAGGAS